MGGAWEDSESSARTDPTIPHTPWPRLVSPIAPYAGPIQQKLGKLLVLWRAAEHALSWEDTQLTLTLCAACVGASLLLVAL